MNKIIILGIIFIVFLFEASTQSSTKRINLINIDDLEFSEAISKTDINYVMPHDGRFLYCYQQPNMLNFRQIRMHEKWKIAMYDFTK